MASERSTPESGEVDLSAFDGHTPGEWKVGTDFGTLVSVYASATFIAHAETGLHKDWIGPNPIGMERAQANARLIAAAPTLLAEVRALRAQVAGMREALEQFAQADCPYARLCHPKHGECPSCRARRALAPKHEVPEATPTEESR